MWRRQAVWSLSSGGGRRGEGRGKKMPISDKKVAERRGVSEVDGETAPVSSGVHDPSEWHLVAA